MLDDGRRKVRALLNCAKTLGIDIPSQDRIDQYLRLLSEVPADLVEKAIDGHLLDPSAGRFFPTPAEIMAKLDGGEYQHLSPDVAWSIALQSFDEDVTVVWTPEIAEARSVALPVWLSGDQIGARMAFKGAYERIIRASRGGPRWQVSTGFDLQIRIEALRDAVAKRMLSVGDARRLLPSEVDLDNVDQVKALPSAEVIQLHVRSNGLKKMAEIIKRSLRDGDKRTEDTGTVTV